MYQLVNNQVIPLKTVTRFEVVGSKGGRLMSCKSDDLKLYCSLQDEERTLKVLLQEPSESGSNDIVKDRISIGDKSFVNLSSDTRWAANPYISSLFIPLSYFIKNVYRSYEYMRGHHSSYGEGFVFIKDKRAVSIDNIPADMSDLQVYINIEHIGAILNDMHEHAQELLHSIATSVFDAPSSEAKRLDSLKKEILLASNPDQLEGLLDEYTKLSISEQAKSSAEKNPAFSLCEEVDNMISLQDITGICGVGRNTLFKILRDREVLNEDNLPTVGAEEDNIIRKIRVTYSSGVPSLKPFVTKKGIDLIGRILASS